MAIANNPENLQDTGPLAHLLWTPSSSLTHTLPPADKANGIPLTNLCTSKILVNGPSQKFCSSHLKEICPLVLALQSMIFSHKKPFSSKWQLTMVRALHLTLMDGCRPHGEKAGSTVLIRLPKTLWFLWCHGVSYMTHCTACHAGRLN